MHSPTITIGHLDSGISSEHSSLRDKVRRLLVIERDGSRWEAPESYDTAYHGTHTAGIICRAADELGGAGASINFSAVALPSMHNILLNLANGMDALLDDSVKIVCLPVGLQKQTPIFVRMVEAFRERGILMVAPIGNKGKGSVHVPACYPEVLSVGAVHEDGRVADFSGSCCDEQGACLQPDLMAPGVAIVSAMPDGTEQKHSGTSMACAYVAGIAAGLLAAQPEARAAKLAEALLTTAKPLAAEQQERCRTGIVQPQAALKYLLDKERDPLAMEAPVEPSFLQKPYQDEALLNAYRQAEPKEPIESLVIAQRDKTSTTQTTTEQLLQRVSAAQQRKAPSSTPTTIRSFRNADMAYLKADSSFYEELLQQPDLFACSAVDVSVFEM